jgi:hypothetical protein
MDVSDYLNDLTIVMSVFAVLAVFMAFIRVRAYRRRNNIDHIDVDLLAE